MDRQPPRPAEPAPPTDDPSAWGDRPGHVDAQSRYLRQIRLPQVGLAGQQRLARACVLVVGLGALGSVAAELLARAGVGKLIVVDRDLVDASNLQRQTLYTHADVGLAKVDAAQRRLRHVNPEVVLEAHGVDADGRFLLEQLGVADVALDATDNAFTRYLLNEAAIEARRPWVYGGAVGTQGRAAAFAPCRSGACLRCVFPNPPQPGELETCESAGVFGGVTTAVAALQVQLVLRLLLEPGWTPDLLLHLDGWSFRIGTTTWTDPGCDTCRGGRRDFLHRAALPVVQLCGREAVQVRPGRAGRSDLAAVARRWAKLGEVSQTPYVLRLRPLGMDAVPGLRQATLFSDGRLVMEGDIAHADAARLRALYDRLVGH